MPATPLTSVPLDTKGSLPVWFYEVYILGPTSLQVPVLSGRPNVPYIFGYNNHILTSKFLVPQHTNNFVSRTYYWRNYTMTKTCNCKVSVNQSHLIYYSKKKPQ